MPVFAFTSPNLELYGAIIDTTIWPDFAVIKTFEEKNEKSPSKKVIGLIDTGASCTAIDSPIAKELNLVVRDQQPVLTPSGETKQYLYDIVITLVGSISGIQVQAFGADLSKQPYDVLLGRDILNACTFIYNGWNNSYDLHFHVDKIKPLKA